MPLAPPSGSSGTQNAVTTTGDTGAKVASFSGITQRNLSNKGAIVTALFGTISGTLPTCLMFIEWSPDNGTTWHSFGAASATVNTTGNSISIAIGVGFLAFASGATTSSAINQQLPLVWRASMTIGGTTPSFALNSVQINLLI